MRGLSLAIAPLSLAACSESPPPPQPVETAVPEEFRQQTATPAPAVPGASIGTPMKDRVATLGLLNKRNNVSQDLTMKPGETQRVGDVIVTLKACERTAPWEMPQETGAFVQVFVRDGRQGAGFPNVFSGWLFRQSPSLNVVEHPVYDVWVKDCTMRFPGEEAGAAGTPDARPAPRPSVEPAPTPVPSSSPSAAATSDATA